MDVDSESTPADEDSARDSSDASQSHSNKRGPVMAVTALVVMLALVGSGAYVWLSPTAHSNEPPAESARTSFGRRHTGHERSDQEQEEMRRIAFAEAVAALQSGLPWRLDGEALKQARRLGKTQDEQNALARLEQRFQDFRQSWPKIQHRLRQSVGDVSEYRVALHQMLSDYADLPMADGIEQVILMDLPEIEALAAIHGDGEPAESPASLKEFQDDPLPVWIGFLGRDSQGQWRVFTKEGRDEPELDLPLFVLDVTEPRHRLQLLEIDQTALRNSAAAEANPCLAEGRPVFRRH